MRYLILLGISLALLVPAPLLDLVGWSYSSESGSVIFKLHPATYIFLISTIWALMREPGSWKILSQPSIAFFIATAILAAAFTFLRSLATGSGGTFSLVVVTFLTPAFALVPFLQITRDDWRKIGIGVRGFFVLDSLIAIGERLVGHRLIPSWIDVFNGEFRASALTGHPLTGAMLTGLMMVHLATARLRGKSFLPRIPEIALHSLAILAFGGRTIIVLAPFIITLSAAFPARRIIGNRFSLIQRFFPLAMWTSAMILLTLPIPFIQQTLDRFYSQTAQSSSETRLSAFNLLFSLDNHELLTGVTLERRKILMDFFNTPLGIEISWIAMIVNMGVFVAIPLLISTFLMLFYLMRRLERSAFFMILLFIIASAGSLSIGSKTLLLIDLLVMLFALCQTGGSGRIGVERPLRGDSARDGDALLDALKNANRYSDTYFPPNRP